MSTKLWLGKIVAYISDLVQCFNIGAESAIPGAVGVIEERIYPTNQDEALSREGGYQEALKVS